MVGRKPEAPAVGSANRDGLELMLEALVELGRLERVDSGLVELCRSTASAVDEFPQRAALVKEYRECLLALSGLGTDGGDDFDSLMGELRGAEVEHPPPV